MLATAGIEYVKGEPLVDADVDDVKDSVRIANAAMQGNFVGPFTSAVSFVSYSYMSFFITLHATILSRFHS